MLLVDGFMRMDDSVRYLFRDEADDNDRNRLFFTCSLGSKHPFMVMTGFIS